MAQKKDTDKNHNKDSSRLRKEVADDKHLLFVGFIVAITSLVVINTIFWIGRYSNNKAVTQKISSQIAPAKVLSSHETANSPVYQISVANATENPNKDPAFALESQQTMLIFDVTITNKSAVQQDLIPANQFYVRSSEGDIFMMHPSSFLTRPLAAGKLKPDATATGQVSFAVPKTLANPYVYIDLGWNDYVPVVYDILR